MSVVFKLGGSLLTVPGLADRLQAALKQRSSENCLIVTGGGASTDVVREWSRIHNLSDETAHWLAISSLDLNRRFVQTLLNCESVNSRELASARWQISAMPLLLDVLSFATDEESNAGFQPTLLQTGIPLDPDTSAQIARSNFEVLNEKMDSDDGVRLPRSWDVTSDALAAWTAIRWPCKELILLKSVPLPPGFSAADASSEQLVDPYFPHLSDQVARISWCNLRSTSIVVEPWLKQGRCSQ